MAGHLTVISGPSGVGKHSVIECLRKFLDFYLVVSYTTRSPRPGEVDGVDYLFVSREYFMCMVAADGFTEWAEFAGNCYGTPSLDDLLAVHPFVVLEIEVQGAMQIKKRFPHALLIFINAPQEVVEQRLKGRETDDPEVIARRLAIAAHERQQQGQFHHTVINDVLERAAREAAHFIKTAPS